MTRVFLRILLPPQVLYIPKFLCSSFQYRDSQYSITPLPVLSKHLYLIGSAPRFYHGSLHPMCIVLTCTCQCLVARRLQERTINLHLLTTFYHNTIRPIAFCTSIRVWAATACYRNVQALVFMRHPRTVVQNLGCKCRCKCYSFRGCHGLILGSR